MQAYVWLGPTAAFDRGGGGGTSASTTSSFCVHRYSFSSRWLHIHRSSSRGLPACSATASGGGAGGFNGRKQNHYKVLGLASDASLFDIKKAYRLLALKYHPDVSKDAGANETFKSIRLAYEILSNEVTRNQYDRALRYQSDSVRRPPRSKYSPEDEYPFWIYSYTFGQQEMQQEYYWQPNQSNRGKGYPFSVEEEQELSDEEEERGSFTGVLQSALLSLFLMHTVGIRLSLTFSSIMAFLDQKLDSGYKIGYLIAWILGGTGGIILTLCLSFASWLCGKTSSGLVALVVVSMWIVSNLARFIPLPQGALLTLLYMSIKLQVDLK